jgi:ubiquinone/menaquinone biosynthesis C-methylase UbiE
VSTGWEDRADAWVAWARKPSHDAYWHYRDAFFELLPPPDGRHALEIGCGEGRVCRELRARGHGILGVDASPSLVAAAAGADPSGEYVVGTAEALPFAAASFELVIAYNSLMDVDDMPRSVAEAARVLRPGGHFCACVVHPFLEAGEWTSPDDDASFVVERSYFAERAYEETFARDGLTFTFNSRSYPLEAYALAVERAGFVLEALREPPAPPAQRAHGRYSRLPMFLMWRARKP